MPSYVSHRNGFWIVLIASLAFNAGFGTTFGVRAFRHSEPNDEHFAKHDLHHQLDLTSEQKLHMEASGQKLFAQVDELHQELYAETVILADLVTAAEPDRAAIAVQQDKVSALRREFKGCFVDHLLEVKTLLSPQQKETFDKLIRQHVFQRHGHGEMGGPHHHGPGAHDESHKTHGHHGG